MTRCTPRSSKWRLLAATTLAVAFGGLSVRADSAAAPASDAKDTQDVSAQIQAMKAQLETLQAKQAEMVRKQEADATKAAVLKDADHHSNLLEDGTGFTAGFKNNRFVIQSEDGSYTLRPWIHIQFRETTNYREGGKKGGTEDDTQSGFEVRRARFGFDGSLFSPDFTYFINWASNRANSSATVKDATGATVGTSTQSIGGAPILEEAWMQYHLPNTDFSLKAGQMHDPLDHENIVGSKYRSPEASLQGDIFGNTDTFTQAVDFIYDPKTWFRVEAGVNDGIRAANTDFRETPNNGNVYNKGVAGRAEFKLMGDWADYNQLTAYHNKKDLLVMGVGVDYSTAGRDSQLSHTFDVQYGATSGLFLYGSYFGRYTSHNQGLPSGATAGTSLLTPATSGRDTYEPSVMAEAAYLINQKFEPYVRYEYMRLAGTPAGSHNSVHEITGGMNYYFKGHNLKFTGEVMYLPNGIPIDDTSHDVLGNNGRREVIALIQMQLLL